MIVTNWKINCNIGAKEMHPVTIVNQVIIVFWHCIVYCHLLVLFLKIGDTLSTMLHNAASVCAVCQVVHPYKQQPCPLLRYATQKGNYKCFRCGQLTNSMTRFRFWFFRSINNSSISVDNHTARSCPVFPTTQQIIQHLDQSGLQTSEIRSWCFKFNIKWTCIFF